MSPKESNFKRNHLVNFERLFKPVDMRNKRSANPINHFER